jgi:hypothetical protein
LYLAEQAWLQNFLFVVSILQFLHFIFNLIELQELLVLPQ